MVKERTILVVAGEASGDMYGARLVEQMRRLSAGPVRFLGCAGSAMRAAGVVPVVTVEEISVHGFVEVLSHLEFIFDGFRRLVTAADQARPDMVVLIDFPDFNIRLARRLKHLSVPMVYFISPQFWAWRKGRIRALKDLVRTMICILPFEESFYREAGVRAEYVGHPLVEMLQVELEEKQFHERFGVEAARPKVALLPGSRKNEIRHNLPTLLKTVERLNGLRPEIQFNLAVSHAVGVEFVQRELERFRRAASRPLAITLIENHTRSVLRYSNVAVVSSGTATLETALLGIPMVCVYRVAPLSWWIGQKLIDVDYYCLVNLILNRPVVPELYQSEFTPSRLETQILRLLDTDGARQTMKEEFAGLKNLLKGAHSPMERAAQIVLAEMETQTAKNESNRANLIPSTILAGKPC